jgi:hypothetical protein
LQPASPKLAAGGDHPDARPGDIFVSFDDGITKVFPRATGVSLIPVLFYFRSMEWSVDRSAGIPPVEHYYQPVDSEWIVDASGRKACIRRSTGNRIERTIYMNCLVEGRPATFNFRSTAYPIGDKFGQDADRVVVEVDNQQIRVVGAIYRLYSELEKNTTKGYQWFSPRFERVARLGEPGGPTIEQVRKALALRIELKNAEAENRDRLVAAGIRERQQFTAAPQAAPALTAPAQRPSGGSVGFGYGQRDHWAAPAEPKAPPPSQYEGPTSPADPSDDLSWD